MDLARTAQRRIEAHADLELLAGATLGIVCFRRRVDGADEARIAAVNAALLDQVNDSGIAFLSSTRLGGRYCVRLAIMNFTTTKRDVDRVLDVFATTDVATLEAPTSRTDRTEPGVDQVWLTAPTIDAATIRKHPLLATLDAPTVEWLTRVSRHDHVDVGNVVVDRWSSARDFHVVLDGVARVSIDGETVRELGGGDFFGELAALDWGADTATSVLADRYDRQTLLGLAHATRVGCMCALTLAVVAEWSPLAVLTLTFGATIAGTPCYPAVAALIPWTVPTVDLAAANALFTTVVVDRRRRAGTRGRAGARTPANRVRRQRRDVRSGARTAPPSDAPVRVRGRR